MLPAIRRYVSPRLRAVYRGSRGAGASFAILSGEFGLIGPWKRIPYYDHLLRSDEVSRLVPRLSEYLVRRKIRAVRFHHEPVRVSPRVKPYLSAIRLACRRAGVTLTMVELKPPDKVADKVADT